MVRALRFSFGSVELSLERKKTLFDSLDPRIVLPIGVLSRENIGKSLPRRVFAVWSNSNENEG
jgi:hypothetical protein